MILDAITSSPFNVFVTIVIGISIAYLYYRRPPSSSSGAGSQSPSTSSTSSAYAAGLRRNNAGRSNFGLAGGGGYIDEELRRTIELIERQERDSIRQEQDAAYQQSLKADKEKQIKREEETKRKEAEERSEQERKERQERLHLELTKLRSQILEHLPAEPTSKDQQLNQVVKLVFKLPDGTRVKHTFNKTDKVKYLYWYVFSLNNAPLQFRMTTNFPKRDLPGRPPVPDDFRNATDDTGVCEPNCELTLEEASLVETQIIFVYDLNA